MKVVFLDVDGVLNKWTEESAPFNTECCNCLKNLILNTGAVIVVSSSWREHNKKLGELRDELFKYGLSIYDTVPITHPSPKREVEILNYVDSHPDIEEYVVLDDWDMRETLRERNVVTCTYHRIGLDPEFQKEAELILNRKDLKSDRQHS